MLNLVFIVAEIDVALARGETLLSIWEKEKEAFKAACQAYEKASNLNACLFEDDPTPSPLQRSVSVEEPTTSSRTNKYFRVKEWCRSF